MKRFEVYTNEDEEKYPKIDKNNLVNEMGVCANCKEQDLEYGAIQLEGEEWYSMEFTGHNVYDENGELIEL